jgi:hypothetical protein
MEALIDRVVKIMGFMYAHPNAEVVLNISKDKNYLFVGWENQFELADDEIDCLINNEIIELDSGCNEDEYVTEVYILTSVAQERIKSILNNKKILLLKK